MSISGVSIVNGGISELSRPSQSVCSTPGEFEPRSRPEYLIRATCGDSLLLCSVFETPEPTTSQPGVVRSLCNTPFSFLTLSRVMHDPVIFSRRFRVLNCFRAILFAIFYVFKMGIAAMYSPIPPPAHLTQRRLCTRVSLMIPRVALPYLS